MAGNVGKAAKHAMRCCCFQPGLQKYKRTKIRQRSFSWFPPQSFRQEIFFPLSQLFVRRRRVKNASPALNRIYCSLSRESGHSCGEYQPLCGLIAEVTSLTDTHKGRERQFDLARMEEPNPHECSVYERPFEFVGSNKSTNLMTLLTPLYTGLGKGCRSIGKGNRMLRYG